MGAYQEVPNSPHRNGLMKTVLFGAALAIAGMVLVLFTSSCANVPPNSLATVSLAEACNAYAGALNVLAPQKAAGALSEEDVAKVYALNFVVDPICTNPVPPADPVDAVTRVTNSVTQVMLIVYAQQKDAQ